MKIFKYKISLEKTVSHSGVFLSYLICGLGDKAQPQAGSLSPQAGSLGPQAGSLSPQAGSLGPQADSLSHFNPHCIPVNTGFFLSNSIQRGVIFQFRYKISSLFYFVCLGKVLK